jgi:hypothetical protein
MLSAYPLTSGDLRPQRGGPAKQKKNKKVVSHRISISSLHVILRSRQKTKQTVEDVKIKPNKKKKRENAVASNAELG